MQVLIRRWFSGRLRAGAILGICIAILPLAGCGGGSSSANPSPVSFSFVYIGCNRIQSADVSPDNPATANLPQLERDFSEIPNLTPTPDMVFFVGDLVLGLTADLATLQAELQAWIQVYVASPLGQTPSIRLIAIPGNHESLIGSKGNQVSNPGAEQVWLSTMAPYIAGDNGPPAGGPDDLETDQSRLTYSFDFKNTHFDVINTDPFGAVATVPVHWLEGDLHAATDTPGIKHIFALGHKPAFVPEIALSGEQSLNINPENRDAFWDELNLARVDAYLPAHVHMWNFARPRTVDMPHLKHVYQVIAGNGGSKVDAGWPASGETVYYGYTQVIVHENQSVDIISYGRDFDPTNYLAPSPSDQFPTTVRARHTIFPSASR